MKNRTKIHSQESDLPQYSLSNLKNCSRSQLPFKIGHLYYQFLSGTYLPVLGFRSQDVADFLEGAGIIRIQMVDGQLYYCWIDQKLTRKEFLDRILPSSDS